MFTFKVDGIEEAMKQFNSSTVSKALTRSLNEIGKKARTVIIKEISGRYNIKRKDLSETSTGRSRVNMTAAHGGNNRVVIVVAGKPISLAYFGAKQVTGNKVITAQKGYRTKRAGRVQGVSVEILKGKRTALRNSFIAAVRAGNSGFHTGVFTRLTNKRFPIIEKRMVTLASMFSNTNAVELIDRIVSGEFGPIFYRNLNWYKSK